MRGRLLLPALALAAILSPATPVAALERTARRIDLDDSPAWSGSASCSLVYYNVCTGWIWLWSSSLSLERLGVAFRTCCDDARLETMEAYFTTPAPSGWGYTGTFDVVATDSDGCPVGAPLATRPHLPTAGWNRIEWSTSVPRDFALRFTTPGSCCQYAPAITDHPSAGPTGPAACGACYATTRATRSFRWGTPTQPLCPGEPFFDGTCNAELLWEAHLLCSSHVGGSTWGRTKALYR